MLRAGLNAAFFKIDKARWGGDDVMENSSLRQPLNFCNDNAD